jgi:hypothetical protein
VSPACQIRSSKRRILPGRRPMVLPALGTAQGSGRTKTPPRPNGPMALRERLGRWPAKPTIPGPLPPGDARGWVNAAPDGAFPPRRPEGLRPRRKSGIMELRRPGSWTLAAVRIAQEEQAHDPLTRVITPSRDPDAFSRPAPAAPGSGIPWGRAVERGKTVPIVTKSVSKTHYARQESPEAIATRSSQSLFYQRLTSHMDGRVQAARARMAERAIRFGANNLTRCASPANAASIAYCGGSLY